MVSRRNFIIGLSVLSAVPLGRVSGALAQVGGNGLETREGRLIVHPVSHASLVLEWGGHAIYVDPVGGAELYADLPAPTAILITHEHSDHYDPETLEALAGSVPMIVNPAVHAMLPEALAANATAMANGEEGAISGIPVSAVPAYNTTPERLDYHPEGRDNGYVLTLADRRVYIAGDTEDIPEMRALEGIDLAFVPMNLPFTMTVDQAADAVNAFRPGIVYPYHHRGSDLDAFAAQVGPQVEVRIAEWYPEGE